MTETIHRSCDEAHREVERLREILGLIVEDNEPVCQECAAFVNEGEPHDEECHIGRARKLLGWAALGDQGRD